MYHNCTPRTVKRISSLRTAVRTSARPLHAQSEVLQFLPLAPANENCRVEPDEWEDKASAAAEPPSDVSDVGPEFLPFLGEALHDVPPIHGALRFRSRRSRLDVRFTMHENSVTVPSACPRQRELRAASIASNIR